MLLVAANTNVSLAHIIVEPDGRWKRYVVPSGNTSWVSHPTDTHNEHGHHGN